MPTRLHRLAEARRQQGISLRSLARCLNTDIQAIRQQESPTSDLRVTELLAWQRVLQIPLGDLLTDSDIPLPLPRWKASQMARLVRLAQAIQQATSPYQGSREHRLAQLLVNQLAELGGD